MSEVSRRRAVLGFLESVPQRLSTVQLEALMLERHKCRYGGEDGDEMGPVRHLKKPIHEPTNLVVPQQHKK